MTPFQHFQKFYGDEHAALLKLYLEKGYLLSTPTCFAIINAGHNSQCWWVEYVTGSLEELICHLPFWLPYMRFHRKGQWKCYRTEHVVRKILKDDPFQDGPSDAELRRGRWHSEGETAQATGTHASG